MLKASLRCRLQSAFSQSSLSSVIHPIAADTDADAVWSVECGGCGVRVVEGMAVAVTVYSDMMHAVMPCVLVAISRLSQTA